LNFKKYALHGKARKFENVSTSTSGNLLKLIFSKVRFLCASFLWKLLEKISRFAETGGTGTARCGIAGAGPYL